MTTMKLDSALTWAGPAGEDLRGKINHFVNIDADKVVLAGSSEPVVGTLIEDGNIDEFVSVQTGGNGKVICGVGALAAGAMIKSDAYGTAITATSGAAGTVGQLLSGGAPGEVLEFVFNAG